MVVYTDRHRIPFQIDEADHESVGRYSWAIGSHGYPTTSIGKYPHGHAITLHEFLLGPAAEGLEWDHRDRDRLNNQRHNLRAVTHVVNARNTGIWKTNTSGARGVARANAGDRFRAYITVGGRQIHLGCFGTIEAAAAARRAAESELWSGTRSAPQGEIRNV